MGKESSESSTTYIPLREKLWQNSDAKIPDPDEPSSTTPPPTTVPVERDSPVEDITATTPQSLVNEGLTEKLIKKILESKISFQDEPVPPNPYPGLERSTGYKCEYYPLMVISVCSLLL